MQEWYEAELGRIMGVLATKDERMSTSERNLELKERELANKDRYIVSMEGDLATKKRDLATRDAQIQQLQCDVCHMHDTVAKCEVGTNAVATRVYI
jgi:uncharacterized protein (DUF3084 family)